MKPLLFTVEFTMNKYILFLMVGLLCACTEDDPIRNDKLIDVEKDCISVSAVNTAFQIDVSTSGWDLLRAWDVIENDSVKFENNPTSTGVYSDTLKTDFATFIKHENYIEGWMTSNTGKERHSLLEIGGSGFIPQLIKIVQEGNPSAGEETPNPPA